MNSREEILSDMDSTLEQLIKNANAFQKISTQSLFLSEIEALQKTQESLFARLIHMEELLKPQSTHQNDRLEGIEKKLARLGKLNARVINHVSRRIRKKRKRSGKLPT